MISNGQEMFRDKSQGQLMNGEFLSRLKKNTGRYLCDLRVLRKYLKEVLKLFKVI